MADREAWMVGMVEVATVKVVTEAAEQGAEAVGAEWTGDPARG